VRVVCYEPLEAVEVLCLVHALAVALALLWLVLPTSYSTTAKSVCNLEMPWHRLPSAGQ
jgi:hypothetical protein